jgi:hypothetical protein
MIFFGSTHLVRVQKNKHAFDHHIINMNSQILTLYDDFGIGKNPSIYLALAVNPSDS